MNDFLNKFWHEEKEFWIKFIIPALLFLLTLILCSHFLMKSYSLQQKTKVLEKNVTQQESVHLEKQELQKTLDSLTSIQKKINANKAPKDFQAEDVRKLSEAAGVRVESFAMEENPPWVQIKIQGSANWNSIGNLLQTIHTQTPWVYIDDLVLSPKGGKIKLQTFLLKWQVSK